MAGGLRGRVRRMRVSGRVLLLLGSLSLLGTGGTLAEGPEFDLKIPDPPPQPIEQVASRAKLTWYGEGFLGRHHAAYWHGQTPCGAPEVVTEDYPGIAAPIGLDHGTILAIERIEACGGQPSPFDGERVLAIVVDRMGDFNNPGRYDAWPQVAKDLGFGPTFEEDDGCVWVRIWRVGRGPSPSTIIDSSQENVDGEGTEGFSGFSESSGLPGTELDRHHSEGAGGSTEAPGARGSPEIHCWPGAL